jgi:hypothetical protein
VFSGFSLPFSSDCVLTLVLSSLKAMPVVVLGPPGSQMGSMLKSGTCHSAAVLFSSIGPGLDQHHRVECLTSAW